MKNRFKNYFLAIAILFTILQAQGVRSGPHISTNCPIPLERKISQSLKTLTDLVNPFLSGTLPEKTYSELFQLASQIPAGVNLTGHDIQVDTFLTSLFPTFFKKIPLHGSAGFTLILKREKPDIDQMSLTLTLNSPKTCRPILFSSKKLDLHCQLSLYQQTRILKGSIICHFTASSLTLKTPLKTQIDILKTTLRGDIRNRHYTLTGDMEQIHTHNIRWNKHSIKEAHVRRLLLAPNGLTIRSLSALYQSQSLELEKLYLNFPGLKLNLAGILHLQVLESLSPRVSHIQEVRGPVSFKIKGDFQTSQPTLSGKIQADTIKLKTRDIPLDIINFKTHILYNNHHLAISSLQFSLNQNVNCQGSLAVADSTYPLLDMSGTLSIKVPRLKTLQPSLKRLSTDLLSDIDMTGSLAVKVNYQINKNNLKTTGVITLDGTVKAPSLPIALKKVALNLPFNLQMPLQHYPSSPVKESSHSHPGPGSLKISSVEFGLLSLHDFSSRILAKGHVVKIDKMACTLFQGKANGNGAINLLPPYGWETNILIDRVSLRDICNHISDLKDALSGKVNAHLTLAGNGGKLNTMHGTFKAETIKTQKEPMRISQEFIQKLTGKKGRLYFFQRYRPYNKGAIDAEIHRGIIIFKTLEISHKILGFRDLSISVSGLSNKISLKDFIWEILQVPSTQNMSNPIIKTQ